MFLFVLKVIVHTKMKNHLLTLMLFQTNMIFFLLQKTKVDIKNNVYAVLFNVINVNSWKSIKHTTKLNKIFAFFAYIFG